MRRFFSPDGPFGKIFFRAVRGSVRVFLFRWFRLKVEGRERLRVEGAVIIAPAHRSNLDGPLIGSSSHRRVRYLGKDSLFRPAAAGWAMRALGSFPDRVANLPGPLGEDEHAFAAFEHLFCDSHGI